MSIFYYFPTYVLVARTRALYALCDGMLCSKAYCQMPNDGASLPDDRALVFTILRLPACSVAPTVDMLCSNAYCQMMVAMAKDRSGPQRTLAARAL